MPMSWDLAYADVLAAWRTYLANDNHGRGFVLVGHSQGALMLGRLIKEEIDGKPIQSQMVSALLLGVAGWLPVKPGAEPPLVFPHVPL
jgi:alpha-beta hydrolase superfamily lysophospholipase